MDSQPIFYGRLGRDGKPYAPYGPFAALLALPHHLIARLVAWVAGVPREPLPGGIVWVFLVGGLTMLSSATGAALAVAGFYRAAILLKATPATALILALLLGGATVLWPYGTSFYSEGWQAALLIWTAVFLLDARSGRRHATANVAAAAALLTIVILTKVTSVLFATWFLAAVMLDRMAPERGRARTAAALAAGIAIAVALHLVWNTHRFGDAFDFGYDAAETIPQMPPRTIRLADVPRGLVLLLATPGKSLFLWAPVLLLACVSLPQFWRRERGIAAAIVAAGATGLGFYAAYLFPEAGYSHGPRQLVPLVPLLLLPAVAIPIGARSRAALMGCAAIGFTIALMATSISFLQDQGLGQDLGAGARIAYYERIDPPPGRPWNRYRLGYVPFVRTLTSGQWPQGDSLGHGLDFFPHHLSRARLQLRNGTSIPSWLIWLPPMVWLLLFAFAARRLWPSVRLADVGFTPNRDANG